MTDLRPIDYAYKFWSIVLGVNEEELHERGMSFSHSGEYLKRSLGKSVYFFQDLVSGKRVVTCSQEIKEKLLSSGISPFNSIEDIENNPFLKSKELIYDDSDFLLRDSSSFTPINSSSLDLRSHITRDEYCEFIRGEDQDDIDTLDVDVGKDSLRGLFIDGQLVAISRYFNLVKIPELADVAVMVQKRERGKGHSTIVVSAVIEAILKSGSTPKYRVKTNNLASRSIAMKLGLEERFRLKVWDLG